jgi:hypothetical protein
MRLRKRIKPNQNSDHDRNIDQLFQWAKKHGAEVQNIRITYTSDHDDSELPFRCAVATQKIGSGELIGYIPNSIIISESTARESATGKAILKYLKDNSKELETLQRNPDPLATCMSFMLSQDSAL